MRRVAIVLARKLAVFEVVILRCIRAPAFVFANLLPIARGRSAASASREGPEFCPIAATLVRKGTRRVKCWPIGICLGCEIGTGIICCHSGNVVGTVAWYVLVAFDVDGSGAAAYVDCVGP